MTTAELSDPGQEARERLAQAALDTGEPLPTAEAFTVAALGANQRRR